MFNPSKRRFADQLREAIAQLVKERRFDFDAENFRLLCRNGEAEVNLANLYHEHCSLPADKRADHLVRIASILAVSDKGLPEDFEEARPHLRPKIWNRATFAMMELEQRLKGGEILDVPLYPVGSHLCSSLVFDTEDAMRSVSNEDLEKWSVTFYEAMEVARQNLEGSRVAFAQIGDHFYSSVTEDTYDSSQILLLDRIRSFEVQGERIACVPQRDLMCVADSLDERSLKTMLDLTEKSISKDGRPLCPLPLKLENGEWVDWELPRNHVLRGRYDDFELCFLNSLYKEQQELLEAVLAKEEANPPLVAAFSVAEEKGTKKLLSFCLWSQGVDSLLPRTQMIVFTNSSNIVASGEWEYVASIVGDRMVADETLYPTRYRVREFPSEEELAAIGNLKLFGGKG
ncbi:MAG: DUF1444 family protein [Candidatus Paceibacterota bacterium]